MSWSRIVSLGLLGLLLLGAIGWLASREDAVPANSVTLLFQAEAGGEPLTLDRYKYENPGGRGVFRVRDFRFYLTNVTLHGSDRDYVEPDSYHLARFDNEASTYALRIDGVPLDDLTKVAFSVGVDAAANTSIEVRGDLDPNSQMAWNWEVGYKFVVLEGVLRVEESEHPIVFHVGFAENRRDFEFDLPKPVRLLNNSEIHFIVDPLRLFNGSNKVDLEALQSVKFDRQDARRVAENYGEMITLPAK